MSRAIQRLVAFAIISSILLTGCGGRSVSVSGLHAAAVEDGRPSTLSFKLSNPTPQKIILTGIKLEPIERDIDRDGKNEIFIYSYRADTRRSYLDGEVAKDEIALEVPLEPGQIIEFRPGAEYYVNLVYNPPVQPEIEHQKGLPHGQLFNVRFYYAVVTKDPADETKEIRTPQEFSLEGFID